MENRLTKTISGKNLSNWQLNSYVGQEEIVSVCEGLDKSTKLTFGAYLNAIKNKTNIIGKAISLGENDGLAYSKQSSYASNGYALKMNDLCDSNVAIWNSFWNEIGNNTNTANGIFPLICSGTSTATNAKNTIERITYNYDFDMNFNQADVSFDDFNLCDITPLFENDKSIYISPGQQIAISFMCGCSYTANYGPTSDLKDNAEASYEGIKNFIYYGGDFEDKYEAYNSSIYVNLYDDDKNYITKFAIGSFVGASRNAVDLGLSFIYTNNTSSTQSFKYFNVTTKMDIFAGGWFEYDIWDMITDTEIGLYETYSANVSFSSSVYNIETKVYENSDEIAVKPINDSDSTYYIIPHKCYEVHLNNEWMRTSGPSGMSATDYDGPYQSWYNYGNYEPCSKMYIDIHGYDTFNLYIRSNGESGWDYVMVSQLDKDIDGNTSYSNTTLVKAHTRSNPQSGINISNYTLVTFSDIDGGDHRITIIYRKDDADNEGTDRGFVVIPTNQEKYTSISIKGTKYAQFWGDVSKKFYPNYAYLDITNNYDSIIRCNRSGELSVWKFNPSNGCFVSKTISPSTKAMLYRFESNFFNIKNKLIEEGFKMSATTLPTSRYMYTKKTDSSTYRNIHMTMYYTTSYKKTQPINGISAAVNVQYPNNSYCTAGNNWIFYPATTSKLTNSVIKYGTTEYLTPFSNTDGVAVYVISAMSSATAERQYEVNAYCGFFVEASSTWRPITTTSGAGTAKEESHTSYDTNLVPVVLDLYHNNIVVVRRAELYNAMDIYVYDRITGEYKYASTRRLNFV